jgi:CDP-paratose 2-epimerase
MFIEEFSYAFNLKYIINRCGVISGPLQFGKQDQGFVSLWIWKHLTQSKLKYIGYGGFGNQVRDILHVHDLCELINIQIRKINLINNRLFTIGGSIKNTISLKKLTEICEKITNKKLKISKIKKTSIYDIPYFVTDNSKVIKTYGWKPKRTVLNTIKDTYNWLKSDKSNIIKYF